jgi:hypothetical protein
VLSSDLFQPKEARPRQTMNVLEDFSTQRLMMKGQKAKWKE